MTTLFADVPASVSFVPRHSARPAVDLGRLPVIAPLLRQLGRPLAELARRARRFGPAEGGTVVLVTGCRREVGCSTVALALAAAAAGERPVLLIDGDLARAGLSALVGGSFGVGWDEAVAEGRAPGLVNPGDMREALAFLPLTGPAERCEELLTGPAVDEWVTAAREAYALVVIDAGPVTGGAPGWASRADAALIVCDGAGVHARAWAPAWDRLEEAGAPVLGVIESAGAAAA